MDKSLLYIKGNIPGAPGTLVKIRDSVKKVDRQVWDLQYPTYIPTDELSERVLTWDGAPSDPFEDFYHENDVVSGNKDEGGEK